jgi:hypothetical protein
MNIGHPVYAQIMRPLALTTLCSGVARYDGKHKVKTFSCLGQYLSMAFAERTYCESLRDSEAWLGA